MTERPWSPGPWTAQTGRSRRYGGKQPDFCDIVGPPPPESPIQIRHQTIFSARSTVYGALPVAVHNATLAAQAPALYEALEQWVKAEDRLWVGQTTVPDYLTQARQILHAANPTQYPDEIGKNTKEVKR